MYSFYINQITNQKVIISDIEFIFGQMLWSEFYDIEFV